MRYRKTIADSVKISGVGVHSGEISDIIFHPAPYGSGLVFQCPDIIPAHWDRVTSTHLSTTIQNAEGHSVSMIEHMLAACYGLGITDLVIQVIGKEGPILDGTSKKYAKTLASKGFASSTTEETRWLVIKEPIRVSDGDRWVEWAPGDPMFSSTTTPDQGVLHAYSFDPVVDSFEKNIAPARTFMRLADVERMRQAGYLQGGSLDVALVWDQGKPINPGGMHMSNETARHKILDMMGDFALLGAFIYGQTRAFNTGHLLNYRLMCALHDHPHAVDWCDWSQLPHEHKPMLHSASMQGSTG
jgi:UDP-3-O-[3-hydroxymyristoyl] N-acetylglucosamine deacetylase